MSDQAQELPQGITLLNEFNFTDLSQFDKTNILELHELAKLAPNIAEKFLKDLNLFNRMAFDPFGENLLEEPITEEFSKIQDTVRNIFGATILKTTKAIAKDLEKELENKTGTLFNGFLASTSIKILETIIDFEKTIDQLFPDSSKKIIKAIGNRLAGLIGIYSPTIGILFKASGIIDKACNFLSCDNLMIEVVSLKKQIHRIEQNKKLQKIYQTGGQLALLSEITDLSAISLSKLGLSFQSLAKVIDLLKKGDLEEKTFIQNILQTVELMPNNKEDLNKKLDILKENFVEILKEQNLPDIVQKSLESKVTNNFKDIALSYNGILDADKSFFERLVTQEEAANKIIEFVKEFKHDLRIVPNGRNIESNITNKVTDLVQKNMHPNSDSLLKQAIKSPLIAKELGMNVQTKIFLERFAPKALGSSV